jgi:hypothetical protein
MGIHRGPNTVKDSLVFGYDTGYGVANNNTATRFYPGEPTVNLLNYDTTMPTWPSSSSNMAILTSKTSARSFTVIGTCNVPGAMTFVYPSITANATYHTISATFTNNSTETSNVALYIRGKNNDTSTVNQSQTTTMQPGQSIRKTLIGNVLTVNGGYTAAVGVWSHGTSGQVNMNVTDIQFEETTHATPFVDGTRSSTQSLIDLKRTTSIDVSNVSFNSTGQPTFDGTDDRIDLGYAPISGTGDFTITSFYKTNTSSANTIIGNYPNGNLQFMGGYGLFIAGSCYFTSTPLPAGTYCATATRESGVCKIYLNGELQRTVSNSNNIGTNSFRIGANTSTTEQFNGDIYTVKVYNRALSSQEVQQNYNTYKNRFNI